MRKAMTYNPHLKVFVGNGYYDLGTPYFATEYTFNHLGLNKSLHTNVSMEYYEAGQKPVLSVGNLDARRDFTDVRDIVRGYWLALEKGEPGEEYNLCSGRAWTIREMLDYLLALSTSKIKVETDPTRLRPSDVPVLLGDYSKFKKATGWEPKIPFEQTLKDLLAYWRER